MKRHHSVGEAFSAAGHLDYVLDIAATLMLDIACRFGCDDCIHLEV